MAKTFNITNLKKVGIDPDPTGITQVNFWNNPDNTVVVNIKRGQRGQQFRIYPGTYVQVCEELASAGFTKHERGKTERWTRPN